MDSGDKAMLRWVRFMVMGVCLGALIVLLWPPWGPENQGPEVRPGSEAADPCEGITVGDGDWPAENSIVGPPMDAPTAMRFLFDHYDATQKVATWCPAKDSDAYRFYFEPYKSVDMLSAIAFSEPYSEGGHPHFIVVVQTAPVFDSCHGCSVVLGAAVFAQVDDVWRLKHFNPAITSAGSYGRAPEDMTLVEIGPDLHAVAVTLRFMGQGQTVESYLLLGPVGHRWEALLFLPDIGGDYRGNCDARVDDPNDPMSPKCWVYSSGIRFVPGADATYFDIEVETAGTESRLDNTVVPFERSAVYGFNGCRYTEGAARRRSDDHPYCIQVAAFKNYRSARDLADRLRAAQFASYCDCSAPAIGRSLFRVRIGDYRTREEAKRRLPGLKRAGFEGIVRER